MIAQGASAINFLRQLGGAIGVSLVGIVLEWRLTVHHTALISDEGGSTSARVQAFNETFWFVAVLCAVAVAVAAAWKMQPKAE